MVFCNRAEYAELYPIKRVTILILVDGFLQLRKESDFDGKCGGHNPYFSRWFSAILQDFNCKDNEISHNPYFSRWFSAIK